MRLFGHPIHPMLVHFPIVLWTVAAGAYVAGAAGVTEPVAMIAKFANSGGLIMAMLAMLAGVLELRSISSQSEAMRVATWHMMIMATVWICFLVALMLSISVGFDPSTAQLAAAACAVAGFLLMGVGGWYGGRLVYEFGVAVKDRT
ncbi:MAG: DUF2231 domain-containing protein [Bradyrhizobium sp.]|jgi:uncharacterized membrane protein|uniref:DUF2231 domain-containing protein n=1 Tax=Bradyrhizobium sp. TaxID=376 RepID=UPI003BE329C3